MDEPQREDQGELLLVGGPLDGDTHQLRGTLRPASIALPIPGGGLAEYELAPAGLGVANWTGNRAG